MKNTIIDRVVEELKEQGRAENTQEAYAGQLRRFQEHFKRPLIDLGEDESREFSRHLARKFGPGSATQQQFGAAVRFVYRVVLRQPDKVEWLRMPRKLKKLVLWVPKPEVLRCIEAARSRRDRVFVMLAVGTGMRIGEVANLQTQDIDSAAGVIRIREGKGRKGEACDLSPSLLRELRLYWLDARPKGPWMFPGGRGGTRDQPISRRQIRCSWATTQKRAGLRRHYRYHSLRHSFATFLLDDGIPLPTVQVLLGHANMSTTLRYVHVQARHVSAVRSPLESLGEPGAGGDKGSRPQR